MTYCGMCGGMLVLRDREFSAMFSLMMGCCAPSQLLTYDHLGLALAAGPFLCRQTDRGGKMRDLIDHLLHNGGLKLSAAGGGLSAASGLWGRIGENHAAIASVGVVAGIAIGIVGLVIQILAARRADARARDREAREREAHAARMAALLSRRDDDA